MYEQALAAIRSEHDLGGLKQQKHTLSQFKARREPDLSEGP